LNKTISNELNLQVLYEDNHLIAVNKRPGDIVQGDKTRDKPLSEIVKAYIKKKYNKPGNVFLGVAHRLDRPTSGVVVFARTSKALARLNSLFAGKETEKTYWALVKKKPPKDADTLKHWLKKNPKQNKSYPHANEVADSKLALLDYKLIKSLDRYFLLEIDLHTGRHHQIRAQLAAIGCPIKGDLKYGYNRSNPDGSIHLHARSLKFVHPVKKEEVTLLASPPPGLLWDLCQSG
jgi:23S rRNA pseudouridine1911/1915/1917 synthase